MGAADSKQKLGERVITARKKLEDDRKMISERVKEIKFQSPQTMKAALQSVAATFTSCSPFLEPVLLIAWESNPEKCQKIILDSCRRVLNAPINKVEYDWFMRYVFTSSVWMFKTKEDRFMYEELIVIAKDMQKHIIDSMNSIYNHLEYHPEWKQLLNIKNENVVSRQDNKKVGLLQNDGIKNVLETKHDDDNKSEDLQTFIDGNLAVNILTTTAKNINQEFQNHIQTVMSSFGDYKAGPIKKVDRCLSKLENDYQKEAYPKAAKLLDLVRCSVTFNTVDQLVAGYKGLRKHMKQNASIIELARVKNGFLDKQYKEGYRDIKVNVIYHSTINPQVSMICEVQLLLGQYLHEKKRIHKLYSIVRQELYFKMCVTEEDGSAANNRKDLTDLKFKPILNAKTIYETEMLEKIGKCSVDSDLGLLAIESKNKISCINIKEKRLIFQQKLEGTWFNQNTVINRQSHAWISIDKKKYLAVKTTQNCISFFEFDGDNNNAFKTPAKTILVKGTITCCEFDKIGNIIIVRNGNKLEKRVVKDTKTVLVSIKLEKKIEESTTKTLSLSNDGKWCVIGGGWYNSYFYLIEIDKKKQHKMTCKSLQSALSVCFVNGDANFCVVGDNRGNMEVWGVKRKFLNRIIKLEQEVLVGCITSTNNILAVGSDDKKFTLWDTSKWEIFWSEQYEMEPSSVHLTDDSKYLTIGGWNGEKCLILGIQ